MDLQSKLILAQFDAVFSVYAEWINPVEHPNLTPVDRNIKFQVKGVNGLPSYQFLVNWHGQECLVESTATGKAQLDIGGRVASYGELHDLLGCITYEMFNQLKKMAEHENIPPENLLY